MKEWRKKCENDIFFSRQAPKRERKKSRKKETDIVSFNSNYFQLKSWS